MSFDICPRCEVETKDLHEDDGLCPKCEGEWVEEYKSDLSLVSEFGICSSD